MSLTKELMHIQQLLIWLGPGQITIGISHEVRSLLLILDTRVLNGYFFFLIPIPQSNLFSKFKKLKFTELWMVQSPSPSNRPKALTFPKGSNPPCLFQRQKIAKNLFFLQKIPTNVQRTNVSSLIYIFPKFFTMT